MTTHGQSVRPKQGMARLWRAILDWDQAINTDPIETALENLERRVLKLEREQTASHAKD